MLSNYIFRAWYGNRHASTNQARIQRKRRKVKIHVSPPSCPQMSAQSLLVCLVTLSPALRSVSLLSPTPSPAPLLPQ